MDKLYIGDIPKEYKYAVFNNYYVDLYNTSVLHNNTYNYYRVYLNVDGFLYTTGSSSYGQYSTVYANELDVTDNFYYRRDFSQILQSCFIYFIIIIFLINLFTSTVKKGGLLRWVALIFCIKLQIFFLLREKDVSFYFYYL